MSEKQPAHPVGATVACGIHYLAKVLVTSSCHRRVDMARWQLRRPWRRQEYSVRHTAYSVQYTPYPCKSCSFLRTAADAQAPTVVVW